MSVTIDPSTQNIQLTRGDSFSFVLNDKETGTPFVFSAGDKITFTARLDIYSDNPPLIQKEFNPDEDGHIIVVLEPQDTKSLDYCTAYYDMQWTKANGDIHTMIPRSGNTGSIPLLQICPEVTR